VKSLASIDEKDIETIKMALNDSISDINEELKKSPSDKIKRDLLDYKEKYGAHPSHSTITTILRTELEDEDEGVQTQIRDFFASVLVGDIEEPLSVSNYGR